MEGEEGSGASEEEAFGSGSSGGRKVSYIREDCLTREYQTVDDL
jgi:hypothetical protein